MLTIVYCDYGDAINDFYLDNEVQYIKECLQNGSSTVVFYSTENIILRLYLEMLRGELSKTDISRIQFKYADVLIKFNHTNSRLEPYPDTFLSIVPNIRREIYQLLQV